MEYEIVHLPNRHSFDTKVEGHSAHVIYRLTDDKLDIIHTYVPKAIEGRGIADALVRAAYTYALENDLKPTATCPYAILWLKRHPEFVKE